MSGASAMIAVVVHQLSGESIELDVESNIMVSDLKDKVSKLSRVASAAQTLIYDSCILQDGETLCSQCEPASDSTVFVTLFVSWDKTLSELDALEIWTVEWQQVCNYITDSLKAFARDARSDDDAFVNAMTMLCDHGSSELRYSATEALARPANQGNEIGIAQLFKSLNDKHGLVRRAASSALAPLVERGDLRAIAAFYDHQSDDDAGVRSLVEAALVDVSCCMPTLFTGKGESVASAKSDDQNYDENDKAGLLLAHAVRSRDLPAIIEATDACLRQGDSDMKCKAAEELARVSNKGNEHAIKALQSFLKDNASRVRAVAIRCLASLLQRGDTRALDLFGPALDDSSEEVSSAAASALEKVDS